MSAGEPALVDPHLPAHVFGEYIPPSAELSRALLLTVTYLLADPSFPFAPSIQHSSGLGVAEPSLQSQSAAPPVTSFVQQLQSPLFSFLRLALARCPLTVGTTPFSAVVDVWLTYLQPWHCKSWMTGSVVDGKGDQTASTNAVDAPHQLMRGTSQSRFSTNNASRTPGTRGSTSGTSGFDASWMPFVVYNYHFYTTLLGVFVQRMRDVDLFAGGKIDETYLRLLEKVCAVFRPEVLDILNACGEILSSVETMGPNHLDPWYRRQKFSGGRDAQVTSSLIDEGSMPYVKALLVQHSQTLGFIPVPISLLRFQRDAQRVIDQFLVNIPQPSRRPSKPSTDTGSSGGGVLDYAGNWFSNVIGEIKAEAIHTFGHEQPTSFDQRCITVVHEIRRLFGVPRDYVTSHHLRATSQQTSQTRLQDPERDPRFPLLLSENGVQQVSSGATRCSNLTSTFVGDPLLQPVGSHEIAALVRLSYRLSVFLNDLFKLRPANYVAYEGESQSAFRRRIHRMEQTRNNFYFNFRWIADQGNLIFVLGISLFLWMFLSLRSV